MSTFHFKHFDVINELSSMKVNTDGVLLGAAATVRESDRHVLDAGTGTGTIALLLAQRLSSLLSSDARLELRITGIDIDNYSAAEAGMNFRASCWAMALSAEHIALKDYFPDAKLDLIISNPPYFDDSLLSPFERRSMARHTQGTALSFYSLAEYAREHLSARGRLAVILPAEQEEKSIRFAAACGLYPFHLLRIRTTPKKLFSRVIMEFSFDPCDALREESLTIQDPSAYPENRNGYTPEYIELTKNYYLEEYLRKNP